MPYVMDPDHVESIVRGLLGAIDVDGGATDEQLSVLWSITDHLWKRPDLSDAGLRPLSSADTARELIDEGERRRFHLIMVTLESCRHPFSEAQVERAEEFAVALRIDGADLEIFRDWIDGGVERAMGDWMRCFGSLVRTNSEPSLLAASDGGDVSEADVWVSQKVDPVLQARLGEFHDLPDGSLGQAYLEFYRRNGIDVPGSTEGSVMSAVAVSHDMNHVIAGYEPTGQGEIALGAFQMAMHDSEENLIQFLGNLLIHEAGVLDPGGFSPVSASLQRPGAIELLGEAVDRGAQCRRDFSHTDHLAMAAWSLDEVREEFGVVPVTVVS